MSADGVVVALVAGHGITKQTVAHWMEVDATADSVAASSKRTLRLLAVGLVISWEWTLQAAHEVGVRVGDREAEKQLKLSQINLAQGVGYEWFAHERDLLRFLTAPKVATSDQLWLVKLGMLASKLTQRRIALRQAAIARSRVSTYYRQHRREFVVGERRDIKAIMNKSRARVLDAKRELQAGRSFESVAERFNQSIEGGLRLGRARGRGEKRYEKDYFAAPLHKLVGPFHEILYYIFEVAHIRRGYQRSFTEVEPAIRHLLAARDVESGSYRAAYEQTWRARTRCRTGYMAPGCGRYEVALIN